MDSIVLPHGATGLYLPVGPDGASRSIEIRPDKFIVFDKPGWHYTIHFGGRSGVIDIHRTKEGRAGRNRHRRLCEIRRDRLPEVAARLGWLVPGRPRLVRLLRVGWMSRHGIGIVKGLIPVTDADIEAVTRLGKRKRLVIDDQLLANQFCLPEYLDDVWDFPDGAFTMLKGPVAIGIGIKVTDQYGFARLRWIRLRDIRRLSRIFEARFATLFSTLRE